MTRFIPAQIASWTGGILLQTPEHQTQTDRFYRGISTDSRKLLGGEIFLALRGERFDGHDFTQEAIEKGAGMLILDERSEEAMKLYHKLLRGQDVPDLLLVEDTLDAYQRVAEGYRQTLLATVIGITGSVGKTTTRRMIATVIGEQLRCHETEDNKNNQIGLPLTLLEAVDQDQVIVAELGMDRPGEIGVLSEVAHPDIAVVTAIGYSHAAQLGTREAILAEKTDIIKGMKPNGLILLNGQDEYLTEWAKQAAPTRAIWRVSNEALTTDEIPDSPVFWAEDVEVDCQQTKFRLRASLDPSLQHEVVIPAPGNHLVRAALFALASAYFLGLDMDQAVAGCAKFKNTGGRLRLIETPQHILIDDSYNASPESVSTALDTLTLVAGERRAIACIGGMRELGNYQSELHRQIGQKIAGLNLAAVYLIGEEAKDILAGMQEAGSAIACAHFESSEDAANALLPELKTGDVVLLKGSRFYEVEKIAKAILAAEE
ncbi:MAG: UDP-N-acetylmuramoyl-tripeptide--D-alanyl-D-alanine ligase [Eubacteriales bacterium]|nr:UDP-N-acetylmuramoyl-tripeptide--D-alanyl-D-alanine ligase [Eubacteriales bacterium]